MSTNYIDQITDTAGTTHDISEGDSTRLFRATCSTAASTTAKVATLSTSNRNFSLTSGVRVAVTFTYGNSATTPTLRVDGSSTGTAKTIASATGSAARTTGNGTTYNTWGPYETVIFTYDGTYWVQSGSSLSIYNAYALADSKGSGTVTSVGISNDTNGGLSVSGSPVTSSGSITIGHSNVLTSAQTTSAIYPIKIDKNGHISEYGSAVTIPSITLNGSSSTSPSFYAPTSAGTNGYVLTSSGSGAPSWTSAELTDTKNTAGSTNSTSAIYLIGATSQAANPQTYSNSNLYYSNGLYSSASNGGGGVVSYIDQTSTYIDLKNYDDYDDAELKISYNNGIEITGTTSIVGTTSINGATTITSGATIDSLTVASVSHTISVAQYNTLDTALDAIT